MFYHQSDGPPRLYIPDSHQPAYRAEADNKGQNIEVAHKPGG